MKNSIIFLMAICLISCSTTQSFKEAYNGINDKYMKQFVKTISSDEFEGRKPSSDAEPKTIKYLSEQLRKAGFEPAFGTTYFQKVPLVNIKSTPTSDITISFGSGSKGNNTLVFRPTEEIAITSQRPVENVDIKEAELVFCGFGAVAPEYGWNDYAAADIKGKVAVVFVNDPGLYLAKDPADRSGLFKGTELTIYGRWKYKFEEAARQGAAGILVIHDDHGAGYKWNVANRSSIMGNMFIDSPDLMDRCLITGWIQQSVAAQIFNKLGYTLEELRKMACSQDFKAFSMKSKISVSLKNELTKSESSNVAGILKGTEDPEKAVVLVGHWDHFGIVKTENSSKDSIYNGAVDNGVAMAWAIEIGKAVSSLKERPKKSLVILFPTAEEQGLLGSSYYVEHPATPIEKTILCLGEDMMQPRGRMKDLMLIGYGYNKALDSLYSELAKKQGRYITPDPNAYAGMFFRSDHYPFHAKGVPTLWAMGCYDSRKYGKEWAATTWNKFVNEIYHTPQDNYDPSWDWSGVVEDTQISFEAVCKFIY